MKIGYFINTFKSQNWGGVATSNGIKHLLKKEYPKAEFTPLDLPDLPFKKIKIFRKLYDRLLLEAILKDDYNKVVKTLEKMNIKETIFDDFTHICFNGEGAIHYKSGHIIRLMGLLYLAKKQGKKVASINQTIDLNANQSLKNLLSKVYNMCDFVSVREPLSLKTAKEIGVKNPQLIPDAVYGLDLLDKKEIEDITKRYNLKKEYITITGSSILERDKNSIQKMQKILHAIKKIYPEVKPVFMASTKTDIYLAKKLKDEFSLDIITHNEAGYKEAIAIFANSLLLIGGRQHPNIFAYIYKTPYIAFDGNTFKNEGVALLQEYPIKPLNFELEFEEIVSVIKKVKNESVNFNNIKIEKFNIFDKG